MNITRSESPLEQTECDALVIGIAQDKNLTAAAQSVNQASHGFLQSQLDLDGIDTDECGITLFHGVAGLKAKVLCVVGLGDSSKATPGLAFRVASAAAKTLAAKKRGRVAFALDVDDVPQAIAGSMTGCVGQDLYRAKKSLTPFEEIGWHTSDDDALRHGEILGNAIARTRTLVNEPASVVYPESFAATCETMAKASGLEVEVWDQARLEAENCGSLLAVARGSVRPPRLVILRHHGGGNAKPLALVGKGVTFDSGGLSLKPSEAMLTMKCDMAGAATVVGAMQAIAELKLPVNVIGLVGLVENMVSGDSYKLGDVLTSRKGTTIEIHNTDAEGRLVLADVLNVAVTEGAERIIDLATLTGACIVALGNNVAGMMSNDEGWLETVRKASTERGEAAWPLPMFPEYDAMIQSKVADIKNVGEGRAGGAITAAKLLQQFVDDLPWVHVDIAGPAFKDKPSRWLDAGATGYFVQTLVKVAAQYND